MNIIPFTTIAIEGRHCPAGVVVEVRDAIGESMIAQRFARRAPLPEAAPAAPAVETAAAAPAVEAAAATAKRPKRKV